MSTPDIRVVKCGQFEIEAFAELRQGQWFAEYAIVRDGAMEIPWSPMTTTDLASEEMALGAAIAQAQRDIALTFDGACAAALGANLL